MLLLLPPSEGKSGSGRGAPLDLRGLSCPDLTDARAQVLDALIATSAGPDAPGVLKVGAGVADQVAGNIALRAAPAVPAGRLYSGVLYDALDLASLDAADRRRAARRVVVQSALFGALRLTDKVPAYRLSMSVSLPGVGPLAAFWRGHLGEIMPRLAGRGLVVDCRSSTYAAAWTPAGDLAARWVQVVVPGATHQAKHTRGLAARALCRTAADPRSPEALPGLLPDLRTRLLAPARAGRPWTLEASAP